MPLMALDDVDAATEARAKLQPVQRSLAEALQDSDPSMI